MLTVLISDIKIAKVAEIEAEQIETIPLDFQYESVEDDIGKLYTLNNIVYSI